MNEGDTFSNPLSEQELLELEAFLISERASGNAMPMDALDGFLTALVIGPVAVLPDEWIPFVLGDEKDEDSADLEEAEKIISFLMRYMNSLGGGFQLNADNFVPIFQCCEFENREDADAAATSWALGFILGMELRFEEWKPLFDVADEGNEEEELILAPILLLAGQEHDAHQLTESDKDILKELIAESVTNIHRFWQPYRTDSHQNQNDFPSSPDRQ